MTSYLHITTFAVAGIQQAPNFEFVELNPEYPVLGSSPEGPEPVPARHRFPECLLGHLRTGHVLVDFHGLVAVVLFRLGCNQKAGSKRYRTPSILFDNTNLIVYGVFTNWA